VRFDIEEEINAPPDRVWAVLVDVERWPEWMASYTSVERLSQGPLTVGSTARVRQPGLSAATYTVTELVADVEFTWSSSTLGVLTTGRHVVQPRPGDRTALLLSLEQTGILAGPIGLILGPKIRRFLAIESEGLRTAAETATGGEPHP
jgi:uncharacterized protein YndB with AHSA1/START domain